MDNDSMFPGRVILSQHIKRTAQRMSSVSVEVDASYQTVAIGDDVFMQGEEAQDFIDQAYRAYLHAQYVSIDDCYACLAESYV
jgi:hypothetical protein